MSARGVALVTGGTRGIGLGICRALARDGWSLATCGLRPQDAVKGVLEELLRDAPHAEYVQADISRTDDRARLLAEATRRLGTIDALVNNAGMAPRIRADLLEASEDSFEELIRTNLQGPYFLTQAVARALAGRRADASPRGVIVFVTSVSAEAASTNRGEYCVSKAGLAMAVKLFATRLAALGVPVYEVRPGIIATDMTAGVKARYDELIAGGLVPDGRWGTPEDVGRTVAALLRGEVAYATGTILHVDGGLSIPRL